MNATDWTAWPPPSNASGHIEAITEAGDVTRPSLYHYSDERGSVWGYSVKVADKWVAVHPEYARWRWRGTLPTPEAQGNAIMVWRWWDAPGELCALSDHGGDEDWVALIPAILADEWIGWMESGTSFGCCSVSERTLPDGRVVRIGAHA